MAIKKKTFSKLVVKIISKRKIVAEMANFENNLHNNNNKILRLVCNVDILGHFLQVCVSWAV